VNTEDKNLDKWVVPFGAHKDKPLDIVPAAWLDWAAAQDNIRQRNPEIARYVEINRQHIDSEISGSGKAQHILKRGRFC